MAVLHSRSGPGCRSFVDALLQSKGRSLQMKSLLLTVTLFVLVIGLRAQDDLPFLSEDKNVSGIWYRKVIVNDRNITEQKSHVEQFPFMVRALEKGNMEVMVFYMFEEECAQIEFVLDKTKKPGQYRAFWGANLMYIYELPVMDHYIFYSECRFLEQKVYMGELIGKDPTENHEALEEFKKFAQQKGFPPENIMVPEQRGEQETLEIID